MMSKEPIKNLTSETLAAWLEEHGEPRFRHKQIQQWLYQKWLIDFEDMANIPKTVRHLLDEEFLACSLSPAEAQKDADGTVKSLYRLRDGETIESVLIETPRRRTVCISTQVGCPVRCSFCASGSDGLVRNLDVAEIVDQVVMACRQTGERVTNIVTMGMGEPLLNFDNLVDALDLINSPSGLGIGARRITVSTSGIPAGIRRLADAGRQWNLALSLHATRNTQRARLIPAPHRYPLDEIFAACRYYREKTGRIVTLEYTMLRDHNCGEEDAERLAAIANDLRAKVNLIPYNATQSRHHTPQFADMERFQTALTVRGITATIRIKKGESIQAACGQLRGSMTKLA